MNCKGLVTDLYQLTMANALFKRNEHEKKVVFDRFYRKNPFDGAYTLSLIHISEPTRPRLISYAVFCLKKKKRKKKRKKKKTFFFFFFNDTATTEIYTLSVVGSVRCV